MDQQEVNETVERFLQLVRSNEFEEVKEYYKLEIALECVAFSDDLYNVLDSAIKLY